MRWFIAGIRSNAVLSRNVLGAVIVRGLAALVGLATMPAYLRFFPDRTVLGAWFTILSVFNLVVSFDLGVGNGLRTRIVKPLADGDFGLVRRLVASSYAVSVALGVITIIGGSVAVTQVDWNGVFDTPAGLVSPERFRAVMLVLMGGIALQLVLKNTSSILYALQRNNVANLLGLFSALLLLTVLLTAGSGSLDDDLMTLSVTNVVVNTIPALVATVWLFRSGLGGPAPRPRDVDIASVRVVMGVGSMFLGIQLGLMVINSTDQIFISALFSPEYVVDYQAYTKIFGLISMAFSLLTQPVWSAVAHAYARGDLAWISRASRRMLQIAFLGALMSLALVAALPWVFRMWLGDGVIETSYPTAFVFAALAIADMFTLALTCIANGLGELRVQLVLMLLGALIKFPLVWLFFVLTGNWTFVIVAHVLALIPLIVAQALELRRRFRQGSPTAPSAIEPA